MNEKLFTQLSKKTRQTVEKVEYVLSTEPNGLTFNGLQLKASLSKISLENALELMDNVSFKDGIYILKGNTSEAPKKKEASQTNATEKKTVKRNKPYTPNPIRGYEVQQGKAKIFLQRRASSRTVTLTLTLDDLKELVNAVEKA